MSPVRYQCPGCGAGAFISVSVGGETFPLSPGERIDCHNCDRSYRAVASTPAGLWAALPDQSRRAVRRQWAQLKSWSRVKRDGDVPTATINGIVLDALNELKRIKGIQRPVDTLLYYATVVKPSDGLSDLLDTVICTLMEQSAVLELYRDLRHYECDGPPQTLFEESRGLVDRRSRQRWAHEKMVEFGFLRAKPRGRRGR